MLESLSMYLKYLTSSSSAFEIVRIGVVAFCEDKGMGIVHDPARQRVAFYIQLAIPVEICMIAVISRHHMIPLTGFCNAV